MDGFKNSTKTHYMKGGACEGASRSNPCEGYAKGGSKGGLKGAAKVAKVMGEFKRGELHSGSKKGAEVGSRKQAVAIALSEARKAGANIKPIKRDGGGEATFADLERANRDVGGMSAGAVKAAGRAIDRGNRMSVEEGNESRLVKRKEGPESREVAVQNTRRYGRAEPVAPQTDIDRRLSTLPSQRGEMTRGPAGAGFNAGPLVSAVRGALGFKKGGLAVMPRGKKC